MNCACAFSPPDTRGRSSGPRPAGPVRRWMYTRATGRPRQRGGRADRSLGGRCARHAASRTLAAAGRGSAHGSNTLTHSPPRAGYRRTARSHLGPKRYGPQVSLSGRARTASGRARPPTAGPRGCLSAGGKIGSARGRRKLELRATGRGTDATASPPSAPTDPRKHLSCHTLHFDLASEPAVLADQFPLAQGAAIHTVSRTGNN
mmetsp:Transcript_83465/g.226255  ORF Transcript_83465/g.226255 Transcript_83465/m.226255 type:complete len:204 (-) Transcript_83465:147-758(-)